MAAARGFSAASRTRPAAAYASDGSTSTLKRSGTSGYSFFAQPTGAPGPGLHPESPGPVAQCALNGP
eukprot:3700333-Prymnesium_polylepis.1